MMLSRRLILALCVLWTCMASGAVLAQQTQSAEPPPSPAPSSAPATHQRMPSPPGAYVYIGWPTDGTVLRSTHFKVWFGTRGFGVAPAGTNVPNTGHHHLLIDSELPPFDQPIPNDKRHLHFGGGQTETFIDLPPGRHTLQLLVADGDHVPQDPPLYSKRITIYVRGQ